MASSSKFRITRDGITTEYWPAPIMPLQMSVRVQVTQYVRGRKLRTKALSYSVARIEALREQADQV
jgi:hypothetical protein